MSFSFIDAKYDDLRKLRNKEYSIYLQWKKTNLFLTAYLLNFTSINTESVYNYTAFSCPYYTAMRDVFPRTIHTNAL